MEAEKNIFTEIIKRLTRVETKLDLMTDAEKIANEALTSSKSAHHRLDKVDKVIFWASTTVIGSVILAMLTMIYNTKLEEFYMTTVLFFATILAPVVMALTELIKRTVKIKKNYIPFIAFAVGIFIGFASQPFTDLDLVLRLWSGGFAGLAATGLFELGNERNGFTKAGE